MLYIKHMTYSNRDPALSRVRDQFGMAGYGAYWAILEVIAEQMTPAHDTPALQLSAKNWRKVTEFSPKKFKFFVTFLQKNGLFDVQHDGVLTTIRCDNLLKIRDEYSSKQNRRKRNLSGQCPPAPNSNSTSTSTKKYTIDVVWRAWKRKDKQGEWLNLETGETVPIIEAGERQPVFVEVNNTSIQEEK